MAKRIVIVGGGLSGLTSAVYARKAGLETVVVEKNPVPGGECTGWDRGGCHIDNCIHWLMGSVGDSDLNRIYRETGAIGDGVEVWRPEFMYTSRLGDEEVTLWADPERTQRELLALSPEDGKEIRALMSAVKLGMKAGIPADCPPELMGPKDLFQIMTGTRTALKLFGIYKGVDTADLAARFQHPLIRVLISDFCPAQSMGSSFPMAYGNFAAGDGGIPVGGSRAMTLRMAKKAEELGAGLRLGSPAAAIRVSGGKAEGVELQSGEFIPADYVVAACDPSHTFEKLLPGYGDAVLDRVYADRKNYPVYGMFQAAWKVNTPDDPVGGDVMIPSGAARDRDWIADRMTVKTYAYEPSFAPQGAQVLQAMLGLSEEAWPHWEALSKDRAAYTERKQELAAKLQAEIERQFPACAGKMELLDCWTPATYRKWCNCYKGYNQAFVVTKGSGKDPYPKPWVKGLDNVLLSGQWLSPPGGVPGAVIQGKYAVQRILHREKLNFRL